LNGYLNNTHARPLNDLRRSFGTRGNMGNHFPDARLKRGRDSVTEGATTIARHFAKVRKCTARIFDFHARRNERNAASTSSSLATPL
jgi:hypothetical protein